MKHLSRDKLAKYHRFSYQPRYYKEEKDVFKFRKATIKRQLENEIAPEHVSSYSESTISRPKNNKIIKLFVLLGLCIGFGCILFYLPISVYSVAVLFIFTFAFVKISKK